MTIMAIYAAVVERMDRSIGTLGAGCATVASGQHVDPFMGDSGGNAERHRDDSRQPAGRRAVDGFVGNAGRR